MEQITETRDKILQAARLLIAEKGFEGTSIRDIAKMAEVNVAAVNYYFVNKDNLFSEILRTGYEECSRYINTWYTENNPELEDLLVHLFDYFLQDASDLLTYFKVLMSKQHSHHLTAKGTEDEELGPPGGRIIAKAIQAQLGQEIEPKYVAWAVRTLFGQVIHQSIIYTCYYQNNQIPFTNKKELELGIRRLCQIVMRELNTSFVQSS